MKTMYYYNQEVQYLQDIGDSRALIFIYGETGENSDGEYYSDDIELIVDKNRLTDKKIDIDNASGIIIDDATREAAKIRSAANLDAINSKRDMEKELKDLKKQIKLYTGLEKSLRFMNPEYKYILTKNYWDIAIKEMKDVKTSDSWSSGGLEFQAIVIRHGGTGDPQAFISRYKDGSGGGSETIIGFYKTENEAIEEAIPLLEEQTKENNPRHGLYITIKKYHLETRSVILAEYVLKIGLLKIEEKRKRKEVLLKEIEKANLELEKL